jgi:hypothetical protein
MVSHLSLATDEGWRLLHTTHGLSKASGNVLDSVNRWPSRVAIGQSDTPCQLVHTIGLVGGDRRMVLPPLILLALQLLLLSVGLRQLLTTAHLAVRQWRHQLISRRISTNLAHVSVRIVELAELRGRPICILLGYLR